MKSFFSHDEGARNDPKLIKVLMRLGQAGKGVYWDIIEMLYEQDGYLLLSECESYAFALRTDCDLLTKLLTNFELFENDGTQFWSNSVLRRLELRKGKSAKAAESAAKRWQNANAMRTHSEGNASKGKEIKGKEIKEKGSLRSPGESAGEPEKKIGAETPTDLAAQTPAPTPPVAAPPHSPAARRAGTYREYDAPGWPEQLNPPFETPAFHAAWAKWGKYLAEIGKPHRGHISEDENLLELRQLADGSHELALTIISKSISNGWKSLNIPTHDASNRRTQAAFGRAAADGADPSKRLHLPAEVDFAQDAA